MYDDRTAIAQTVVLNSMPKIPDQLKHRKADLEKQLEEVNRAIAILDKNPEMADLLTILRRTI